MDNIYILSVKGYDISLDNFFCVSKYFYATEKDAQFDIDRFINECSNNKYLTCLDIKNKYNITIKKLIKK